MAGRLEIDDALIHRLAELLERTGLSEIEISHGKLHVRVARNSHAPVPASAPAAPQSGETVAVTERVEDFDESHPGAVCSPMVGTVYLAPEPGAEPFITVGGQVAEGDTLFIIEAMKTMNPVRAPRSGRVTHVLAHNAAPVEYGEVLVILE